MTKGLRPAALAFGLVSVFGIAGAGGQQTKPLALERLKAPVTLDGMPDEPAWQQIASLPLTMYSPVFRGAPTQRSEIRVAYDDENFYAAGWFYDSDPNGIRVNSLYRDRWNGDDAFAIYIDAFNDNRNAKWFGTTPSGMRFDILVSDDGVTQNASWDTFWDSKARITNEGWFVEIRIPFSSIGFQAVDGKAVMGLTVTRLVSRLNERVTFPAIEPKYEFRQPSVAQDVELTGVHSSRPLYVTPYLLTGVTQAPFLPTNGIAFRTDRDVSREVGLDLRYPLSSELTLDVTTNTDFAQVEADDQQVNLDRFSLFYPDKRRFFQERSEIFDFVSSSTGRVFHSRQIGLRDGQTVPVLGGARLVGRMSGFDVGVLNMQTQSVEGSPTENFGVARVKHKVFNPYSYVGGVLTTRVSDGRHNIVYGTDALIRVFGNDYLSVGVTQSVDDTDADSTTLWDRTQTYLNWRRRTTRGLMYELSSTHSGPEYRPELGFLSRRDFTTANVYSEYYFFTDKHPYFRRIWPGMIALSTFRNSDRALESGQYAVWVEWETKAGGIGWIEPKMFHEDVVVPFTIGGTADIPQGSYDFADLQLYFSMPSGKRMRTTVDFRTGTYFDGTRTQVIFTPTWNVSPHLEIGGDYQLSLLRFEERHQKADVHLARLRVRAALDARTSGNALVQYNSTTDQLDLNLRLRYAFAEGSDLWLVYNEGLDTERSPLTSGLVPPVSRSRALLLKYTHTFSF